MKILSHTVASSEKTTAHTSSRVRVCMHVQGIARTDPRVMREATTLVEAGYKVSIVDIEGEVKRPVTEETQGVHLRHVLMPNWYISTRFPWSLVKATKMFIRTTLRLIGTRADMYHAHDVPALPACYIAARLRRKPLIFDAHELPLDDVPLSNMSVSRRFIHPLLTWLFAWMLPRCAGAIATSSPMADEIARRYHYPEVSVVRNFPFYQVVEKSDRLRQHLGLSPGVRIALYQGNIQPDRQLDRLVRAAAFLERDIVLVMMGKAEEATLSQLKTLIENEGVADRVKILAPVPYVELLDWTASADIGLCILPLDYTPHLKVCLPNKLFEYVMVGLPQLVSPLDAIAEAIRTYDAGQVLSSQEPAEVGAAINAMLADPVALSRMRQSALEAAQQELCWEKERLQLVHLYQKTLEPVKVCMHVLGKARSDVRAMRAATTLVESGYSVSVIDIEGENERTQLVEEIDGVDVKHIIVPDSFIATRFKRWALIRAARMFMRATLRLVQTPADIYHALDLPALPACYIAALLRRKPLIFEAYELPLSTLPVSELSTSRRWLHRLLTPLLEHILPRCAGVIAVSPPIVRELCKRYHISKVDLIRNIPEYRDVQRSDRLRQHLGLGPDVRIALYQGNIQPDRELDRLVRAAAFLEPGIVIVIMGSNSGATQMQLEALIASEGISDRVKILAPVPYAELLDWTASADIGLIVYRLDYSPNVQMMLPNKLFEYMMAGLPVLASPLDAVAEVIRTHDAGQVLFSIEPAGVGAAINAMLADPVALSRMRQSALEAAQQELCWEKERLQLLYLYQEIR